MSVNRRVVVELMKLLSYNRAYAQVVIRPDVIVLEPAAALVPPRHNLDDAAATASGAVFAPANIAAPRLR
jgi:hypothetical protein